MSKAFAFVAALACFLPAVTACSSSDNSTGTSSTKKDSGSSSDDSSDDDASGDDDASDVKDAGKDAKACTTIQTGISLYAGQAASSSKCKSCINDNCTDEIASCSTTDVLSCGASNCSTECAPKDSGATATPEAGASEDGGGEGGAAGVSCTTLKKCCPLVSGIFSSCDSIADGGNEAACKQVITTVNMTAPVCN